MYQRTEIPSLRHLSGTALPSAWFLTCYRASLPNPRPGNSWYLEVHKDGQEDPVARYNLSTQKLWVVGRNDQYAHILSLHESISRQNTALCYNSTHKSYYVIDLKSAHGTQVNGKKIAPWVPVAGMSHFVSPSPL